MFMVMEGVGVGVKKSIRIRRESCRSKLSEQVEHERRCPNPEWGWVSVWVWKNQYELGKNLVAQNCPNRQSGVGVSVCVGVKKSFRLGRIRCRKIVWAANPEWGWVSVWVWKIQLELGNNLVAQNCPNRRDDLFHVLARFYGTNQNKK